MGIRNHFFNNLIPAAQIHTIKLHNDSLGNSIHRVLFYRCYNGNSHRRNYWNNCMLYWIILFKGEEAWRVILSITSIFSTEKQI